MLRETYSNGKHWTPLDQVKQTQLVWNTGLLSDLLTKQIYDPLNDCLFVSQLEYEKYRPMQVQYLLDTTVRSSSTQYCPVQGLVSARHYCFAEDAINDRLSNSSLS